MEQEERTIPSRNEWSLSKLDYFGIGLSALFVLAGTGESVFFAFILMSLFFGKRFYRAATQPSPNLKLGKPEPLSEFFSGNTPDPKSPLPPQAEPSSSRPALGKDVTKEGKEESPIASVVDTDDQKARTPSLITNSALLIDWKGIPANLSPEQQNYNELRGHYAMLATDAAKLFSTEYENQFKSLENIVQNASTLAVPHIQGAIDDAIEKLADRNIFDIDSEYFTATYFKRYDTWSPAHERIAEQYAEIVCSTAEMDAYRTARRQNSGQVIGGGFGLDGVVQGLAVAGAANLAIGAAHGLFNLVAKGLRTIGDSGKKNQIFVDPQTKAALVSGLEKSVLNVHLSLLDALDASTDISSNCQRVSISDQDKALRMLTNLQRGALSNVNPGNVLTQVLTLDPYCLDAYIYALNECGDVAGSIEQMANFFHLNLIEEKRRMVRALYRDTTEIDVINSIREIDQIGVRLGIPVESEFMEPLKVALHKFDVEARTFKRHLYPTREAAKAEEVRTREEQEKKIKDAFDSVKKVTSQVLYGTARIIKFFLYCLIGLGIFGLIAAVVKLS